MVLVNSQTEALFGYDREKLIGRRVEMLIPERFRSHHPDHRHGFMGDPKPRPMGAGRDLYGLRIDGSEFPIEIGLNPIRTSEGLFVLASIIDITERKRAMEQTVRLAAIVEASDDAIIGKNLEGVITSWNRGAERLYGHQAGEVIGTAMSFLLPPEHRDELDRLLGKLKRGEHIEQYDTERLRKDGTRIQVAITISPLINPAGQIMGAAVIARDITERKRAEERFRLVVEAAPNAMIMVDGQGKIGLVNHQAEVLFGHKREELIGKKIEILVPQRFRPEHPHHRGDFFKEPRVRPMGAGRDLFGLNKNGTEIPIEIGLNPIETPEGLYTLASIIDITARKRAEDDLKKLSEEKSKTAEAERTKASELEAALRELKEVQGQLIQAEKLSSIGRLSAGIAHELNSPLQGLMGLLKIYQRRAQKDSKEYEQLSRMAAASEYMAKIVLDLTTFARQSKGEPTELDLREVIESTLGFSAPQLEKKGIKIIKKYADPPPVIRGDKGQLQQVVLNMLTNAGDAMPNGGELFIETRGDNGNVIVQFEDTGEGIPKEILPKIFDPFFTTKPPGKGIGLGLALTHGIVQGHGGEIAVRSEPGKGTNFTITFPKRVEVYK